MEGAGGCREGRENNSWEKGMNARSSDNEEGIFQNVMRSPGLRLNLDEFPEYFLNLSPPQ